MQLYLIVVIGLVGLQYLVAKHLSSGFGLTFMFTNSASSNAQSREDNVYN